MVALVYRKAVVETQRFLAQRASEVEREGKARIEARENRLALQDAQEDSTSEGEGMRPLLEALGDSSTPEESRRALLEALGDSSSEEESRGDSDAESDGRDLAQDAIRAMRSLSPAPRARDGGAEEEGGDIVGVTEDSGAEEASDPEGGVEREQGEEQ